MYDVCVVGGGPAGIAAAVSSSRQGAKTLLIERYGFLGGMSTAGFVHPWMIYGTKNRPVIAGIFQEIIDELKKKNHFKDSEHFGNRHHCFDVETLKFILQEKALHANVELLLHTTLLSVEIQNTKIRSINVTSKSGIQKIEAKSFIDCSGDGDLFFLAGVPFEKGRLKDGLMQPVSLHFRVGNVDTKKMPGRDTMTKLYLKACADGRINCPRENILWFDTVFADQIHFNTTRVNKIDGTSNKDLTRAEIESRRQTHQIFDFLKKDVAGFENSFLLATATQVGIRETRRMQGVYVLTEQDLLEGKMFDDRIALGCYGIDIHNPKGQGTEFRPLGEDAFYSIPYRSLLPKNIQNLVVAGRPISATHEAHSAIRIQPICFATGEAAGVAGAMASHANCACEKISVEKLQNILRKSGALLE